MTPGNYSSGSTPHESSTAIEAAYYQLFYAVIHAIFWVSYGTSHGAANTYLQLTTPKKLDELQSETSLK